MLILSQFISIQWHGNAYDSGWLYGENWFFAFVVGLAFLFHFNRLLGFIITMILRFTIARKHNVDINIESLRVLFLGGRIFAKNLVIISKDYTYSILNLHITWRYWITSLTRETTYQVQLNTNETLTAETNEKSPSRIAVDIEGLEIFMYNRTFAYENIETFLNQERAKQSKKAANNNNSSSNNKSYSNSNNTNNNDDDLDHKSNNNEQDPSLLLTESSWSKENPNEQTFSNSDENESNDKENGANITKNGLGHDSRNKETPGVAINSPDHSPLSELHFWLKLLPVAVRIKVGSFIMGNPMTPSIVVASYTSADVLIDVAKAPSTLDKYRNMWNLNFNDLKITMKPNVSFDESRIPETSHGVHIPETLHRAPTSANLRRRAKYKAWFKFQDSINLFTDNVFRALHIKRHKGIDRDSLNDAYNDWKGLERYVGSAPTRDMLGKIGVTLDEYARVSTILDTRSARVNYYFDCPGLVPNIPKDQIFEPVKKLFPGYGVDVALSLATIHYGPWADKQRVSIHNTFFPSLYRDELPSPLPIPGTLRQYSGFQILVEVKDELRMRIPTREPSKETSVSNHSNHKVDNSEENSMQEDKLAMSRPFGWVELKMIAKSSVRVLSSFLATKNGWSNKVEAEFIKPEIRTSVNHDILLTADSHSLHCSVGFPLKWDGDCNWTFTNFSRNASIFFIREHTMLISDLIVDLGLGGSTPYEFNRSFHYQINWDIDCYRLFLNVNNGNIIDNPLDFSSNKILSFQGSDLSCRIEMPLNGQLSKSSTIEYQIKTSYFDLILDTPPWHTTNAFMEQTKSIGKAHNFTVEGSYTFFSSIELNTADHIVIKCLGDYVTLISYGFVVKYILAIRENYFGDYKHFKTFEEYTSEVLNEEDSHYSGLQTNSDASSYHSQESNFDYWKMPKVENDIDVLFTFSVRHGLLVLPKLLYEASDHIGVRFDSLDVDIRFANYYMELQADLTPLTARLVENCETDLTFEIQKYDQLFMNNEKSNLLIDGLNIHGHRMFGIPPTEPTFHCKWDVSTGDILVDGDGLFLDSLISSIKKVGFGYKDAENDLAIAIPILYDITHLAIHIPSVKLILTEKNNLENKDIKASTLTLYLNEVLITFNDVANDRYTSKACVSIPEIKISMCDDTAATVTYIETSINVNNICQKRDFFEHRKKQQEHVKLNDAPFHRCPFFLFPDERGFSYQNGYGCLRTQMSLPNVPIPLNNSTKEFALELCDEADSGSSKESTYSTDSDSEFTFVKPITEYQTDDFVPKYEVDPRYEYDNVIVELGDVDGFVSTDGLLIFSKVVLSFLDCNVKSLLDTLQMNILTDLQEFMDPESNVKSVSVTTSEFSIKLGKFSTHEPKKLLKASPQIPCTTINLRDAFLQTAIKETQIRNQKSLKECALSFHSKEFFISITEPSNFSAALNFNVGDIELWYNSDKYEAKTCSINVQNTTITISRDQMVWFCERISKIRGQFLAPISNLKKASEIKKQNISEIIYQITANGNRNKINDDPTVLTKLSYILRAKNDHIRFHDSWKLMAKVRHIYNNLPNDSKHKLQDALSNHSWKAPESAYEDVMTIFSKWRSWEVGNIDRSFFFKTVFPTNDNEYEPEKMELHANVVFESIKLSVDNAHLSDYIRFKNFTISANGKEKIDQRYSFMDIDNFPVVKYFHLYVNVEEYASEISTTTIDLIPTIQKLSESFKNSEVDSKKVAPIIEAKDVVKEGDNTEIDIILVIGQWSQQIRLPYSVVNIGGRNILLSHQIMKFSELDTYPFLMAYKSEIFHFEILKKDSHVFSNTITNTDTCVTNFGSIELGMKVVKIKLGSFDVSMIEGLVTLVECIQSIAEHDLSYFVRLFKGTTKEANALSEESIKFASKEKESLPTSAFFQKLGCLFVEFSLDQLTWSIGMFSPIKFSGSIYKSKCYFMFDNGVAFFNAYVQKLIAQLSLNEKQITKFENSKIDLEVRFRETDTSYMIDSSTNLGFTKVLIPQLGQAMELLLHKWQSIDHRIEALKNLDFSSLTDNLKDVHTDIKLKMETQDSTSSSPKPVVFKYNLINDYIGLSTFVNKTKLTFELDSFCLLLGNIATQSDQGLPKMEPTLGELTIPTARIYIIDKFIPFSLSNVLETNIKLNLLNEPEGKNRSFQLESQFCRICGSIPILITIVQTFDRLVEIWDKNKVNVPKPKPLSKSEQKIAEPKKNELSFSIHQYISSYNILAYNFCIGFLFDGGNKSYPGIILGAERFFAVLEQDIGKWTMMEAYLSVAHGSRSSDFFSSLSEKHNLNRAYLPLMQVIYVVEKLDGAQKLLIHFSGDELDVKFLSDSMPIIENTARTSSRIQQFFNKRIRPKSLAPTKRPTEISPKAENPDDGLQSLFTSIELKFQFAGANILLYRLNDGETMSTSPSLFLHSPAIKIATYYKHNKNSTEKKHTIKCEVLSLPSDNSLYSYCVPVIMDIVEGVRRMMRIKKPESDIPGGINGDTPDDPLSAITFDSSSSNGDDSFKEMLKQIDLHASIRISKQKISFSCEPTAKVAAVCELGGIVVQVNSTEDSSLIANVELLDIHTSLQHVYSREISGAIGIRSILVVTKLDLRGSKNIMSAGYVKNVSAYINVKQFQDVNLFKDIWLPKEIFNNIDDMAADLMTKKKTKDVVKFKNLSGRFKEVSTTYAIPWELSYMVLDVDMKVDFGESLGTFFLKTNKIWALSSKSSDWAQDLILGIDQISLLLKGRLGGNIDIEDIFLHALISWNIGKEIFATPLILLSGRIESFKMKASFDHHVFGLAYLKKLSIDIYNQRTEDSKKKDHLSIALHLETSEIFITSLAASIALDIYNAIDRMIQENRNAYSETLRESRSRDAEGDGSFRPIQRKQSLRWDLLDGLTDENKKKNHSPDSFEILLEKLLASAINLTAGHFVIYVFPSSFEDSKVLVVKLDKSKILFEDNEYTEGVRSNLDIQFNGLKLSLSVTAPTPENNVNEISVDEFLEHAHKAYGGSIFVFPSFLISMTTFQKYESNNIEYEFESSFGGTVFIRWNLGSINFIREMFAIHKRALETRIRYNNISRKVLEKKIQTGVEDSTEKSIIVDDLDETINATFDKVSLESKYKYIARQPPKIQAPQLKELGNATPPLEWFGLHREKFPNVTHELAIVNLQKFIQEVEQQYVKVLGRA